MMKIKYEIHTFGMFQYSSKGIKGKHQITEKGIYELCIQIKQYFPANPFIYSNTYVQNKRLLLEHVKHTSSCMHLITIYYFLCFSFHYMIWVNVKNSFFLKLNFGVVNLKEKYHKNFSKR